MVVAIDLSLNNVTSKVFQMQMIFVQDVSKQATVVDCKGMVDSYLSRLAFPRNVKFDYTVLF